MDAVASGTGDATASLSGIPRRDNRERKCGLVFTVANRTIQGICDTGASGGNCLDESVFAALPSSCYRIVNQEPTVCVGVNKMPVRVSKKIEMTFTFKEAFTFKEGMPHSKASFRDEFLVVENLISPIVIGLPFLQRYKAVLDFESELLYMGGLKVPLGRVSAESSLPPPHLASFESFVMPPFSRTYVNTYLTGNISVVDHEKAINSLYVRPFYAEAAGDFKYMVPHAIVDPKKQHIPLEVINIWSHPIQVARNAPMALVDTINPSLRRRPHRRFPRCSCAFSVSWP